MITIKSLLHSNVQNVYNVFRSSSFTTQKIWRFNQSLVPRLVRTIRRSMFKFYKLFRKTRAQSNGSTHEGKYDPGFISNASKIVCRCEGLRLIYTGTISSIRCESVMCQTRTEGTSFTAHKIVQSLHVHCECLANAQFQENE